MLNLTPEAALEREKWEAERQFRERELLLKEQGFKLAQSELALKEGERASDRWRSPLVVAVFAAAIAGGGNAVVSYINANAQTRLEAQKSEQTRILEMIKTGSADKAAENLRFLLDTGLIRDPNIRTELGSYLAKRLPGAGPALPSGSFVPKDAQDLLSRFEGTSLKPYKDALGRMVVGIGHLLSDAELASGTVRISGQDVPISQGISEAQSRLLLEQDLQPIRADIARLVTVPLTAAQADALASFAFQIGVANFKKSNLLRKLNEGRYEEVPEELRRWNKAGGVSLPGLVARREAEAGLWRKP